MRLTADAAAEFVASMTWATLPEQSRQRARVALIDTIGCALGGIPTRSAGIARQYARAQGMGTARVLGATGTFPPAAAAFANGTAASVLDYDDGHYLGGVHPGAPIVSALLTAGCERDAGLDRLLTAQVAGYEVATRVGRLLWPKPGGRFHTSGTASAVGAAVAVAALQSLDADGIRRALQIAWGAAPMASLQMPMQKESLAWAASTGLSAATLARLGFMGDASTRGSAAAQAARPPSPFDDPDREYDSFVDCLGETYHTDSTYLKPYSANRYIHAAAEVLSGLRQRGEFAAGDIDAIEVATVSRATWLTERAPRTLEQGQYSFPFFLAALVQQAPRGPFVLREESLTDTATLALARRITVSSAADLDEHYPRRYPGRVTVRLRSGRVLQAEQFGAWGDDDRPLSTEELHTKFLGLAVPAIGSDPAQQLLDRLSRPEQVSVGEVVNRVFGLIP